MAQWATIFPWMETGFDIEIDGYLIRYSASLEIVRRSEDTTKDDSEKLRRYTDETDDTRGGA
jgi:hypothetical protein